MATPEVFQPSRNQHNQQHLFSHDLPRLPLNPDTDPSTPRAAQPVLTVVSFTQVYFKSNLIAIELVQCGFSVDALLCLWRGIECRLLKVLLRKWSMLLKVASVPVTPTLECEVWAEAFQVKLYSTISFLLFRTSAQLLLQFKTTPRIPVLRIDFDLILRWTGILFLFRS